MTTGAFPVKLPPENCRWVAGASHRQEPIIVQPQAGKGGLITEEKNMKLKVAVVGLGIGRVHLKYYLENPEVEVVGAVDSHPDACRQVASEFKVKTFLSAEELMKETRPDGVSLCTPPASHLALTRIFAGAGVHILCEKPMAPTVSDCEQMMETCEKNRVWLMLGFKKRFSPAYQFLKENFTGQFGLPRWVLARFALGRVEKKWFWDEQDGGGPIVENTVHMIDLLHFFLGEVVSVYAEGGNFFMPEFSPQIDSAIFTLRFKNGAIAGVGAGYASEWGFAREELSFASEKVAGEVTGLFDRPEKLRYVYRKKPAQVQEKNFSNADGFPGEISHFLNCLKTGTEPAVTGKEGLAALKVCQAVKTSVRTGKPVFLKD